MHPVFYVALHDLLRTHALQLSLQFLRCLSHPDDSLIQVPVNLQILVVTLCATFRKLHEGGWMIIVSRRKTRWQKTRRIHVDFSCGVCALFWDGCFKSPITVYVGVFVFLLNPIECQERVHFLQTGLCRIVLPYNFSHSLIMFLSWLGRVIRTLIRLVLKLRNRLPHLLLIEIDLSPVALPPTLNSFSHLRCCYHFFRIIITITINTTV